MHVSAVSTVLLKTIMRLFERESGGNGSKEVRNQAYHGDLRLCFVLNQNASIEVVALTALL